MLPWSAEGLGHGLVKISDELLDFHTLGAFAGKIAATEKLSRQGRKPKSGSNNPDQIAIAASGASRDARELLKLAQIAAKTGFRSESRLRRSLKRQFGVGARALRERF